MTYMKERLVHLVNVDDLSSVQMFGGELGISQEEVRTLLTELTGEGTLKGYLTEDGKRYFKRDAKISEAPVIPREETVPDFLKFDTRPGKIAAVFGLVLAAIGAYGVVNAGDNLQMESFSAALALIGAVVAIAGGFYLTMRKTPT
ncbi:MAG: hypothetical protein ACTSV9_03575 [Candidatus Thorarchaeota archaeon]